ncbi:hypothetical protein HETIRDRAFT_163062 [Heterobasidion irregulare TC 32-1]|uniref:Uncharacterized protein n=1 Tax=Heterobasidion irregulare (strain TC 32-1) TaxID=747525 RepID=W4KDA8_HETIT|nr:uncharacterized protein HETIRDRAFT_163062 [Heterobasidion irregulare TC 32-1]ETW83285.1 hypothetical protein HETIRDRAFT_163062 [Heterobasidion irregulare TC 32-1]
MLPYRLDTQVLSLVCLRTLDPRFSRELCTSARAPDGVGCCEDDAVRKACLTSPTPDPMEDPKLLRRRPMSSSAYLETGLMLRQRHAFAV